MLTYGFLKGFMVAVTQVLFPFKLIGKEKIKDGACVLVGNHYRIWDIVHMACTTKEKVHFITKQELYKNKFLAHLCDIVEAIPVSRDGRDAKAVMTALRYLKKGEKISMFPEGTRNKTGGDEFLPFHGGAALLAIKTKTPVIPFVICNRPKLFKKTHVVFGEPMELSEFYGRKLTPEDYEAAEEKIKNKLYEMRDGFRKEQAAKKAKKHKRK